MTFRRFVIIIILFSLSACTPLEEVVYLQEKEGAEDQKAGSIPEFTLRIKPNDVLSIQVFTINAEAFPGIASTIDKQVIDNRSGYEKGFVVNPDGFVELPMIGSVKLSGLSLAEAKSALVEKFEVYMDEPIVILKHLSFKITIIGEVNKPGLYYIPNEKMTLLEALGIAGDLTYYGNREEVKIIRTIDGNYKEIIVDLTGKEMLSSETTFVYPDDVIYVKPTKRRNFANLSPVVAIITSVVSTLTLIWSVVLLSR